MAFVDYYKILGVDKNIPQKDVRAAYRKRAKQFHPDLHPNDPKAKAKFQALNEAYEVISDPEKRAKYDQYGEQWKNVGGFGGGGYDGAAGSEVPLVEIHSKASTSAASVAEEVSPASSKISSAEVACPRLDNGAGFGGFGSPDRRQQVLVSVPVLNMVQADVTAAAVVIAPEPIRAR